MLTYKTFLKTFQLKQKPPNFCEPANEKKPLSYYTKVQTKHIVISNHNILIKKRKEIPTRGDLNES